MRIVAYLRVSTDRQAEDGLGLQVQEHAIRTWAREHGHRVIAWHRDEGVSGALEDRPALADALDDLRQRRAAGLAVYRLDRLARDLVLQEQLLAEVWRLGAEPLTTSTAEAGYLADDPDDPSRKLIRQVLGAVSEYERSMIALRLRNGRRRKHEAGGYAYGGPPYGMRAEDRALIPDDREQAALARMRELRGQGASLRSIAAALEREGHAPKRGQRWYPLTVSRALGEHTAPPAVAKATNADSRGR